MDLDPAVLADTLLTTFEAAGTFPLSLLVRHRRTMLNLATFLCEAARESLQSASITKPPPELPLEILLMIAHHMRDDDGELRYDDFNSFLQVNRAVYACLNRDLWKEAAAHKTSTQRVLTHLLKTNNLARLKSFLELGADVDTRLPAFEVPDLDPYGFDPEDLESTALIVAAESDNLPLARLLLEKGAQVNYSYQYFSSFIIPTQVVSVTGTKLSPLHAARSAEMVQLLLDHNADPNWEDDSSRQPLHMYAIRHDLAAMRTILQHGAEVNPSSTATTPLHEAAERHLDTVELLVEQGANLDEGDFSDNRPLHLAVIAGKLDVVKFLVERWPQGLQVKNSNQETPLHLAASNQNADMVRFLVEQWPEAMREVDRGGLTPLHLAACRGGAIEEVRVLMDGWPEAMEERNPLGNTPLHLAAGVRRENADVVRFLVERWPQGKRALNNDGDTPLVMFAKYVNHSPHVSDEGKREIITLLGCP
jgi:ankyrin repeat protein